MKLKSFLLNKKSSIVWIFFGLVVVAGIAGITKIKAAGTVYMDQAWLDANGPAPYILSQSDTTYILQTNIVSEGTAFIVDGKNVTLDINNYEIKFGAIQGYSDIPNGNFEQGSGSTIPYWNLSGAPSARIVSTSEMPMKDSQTLKLNNPTAPEEIISDWAVLPANRTYFASAQIKSCYGCKHYIKVENEAGTIVASMDTINVAIGGTVGVKFKPVAQGKYRLRIMFENPSGTNSSYIDDAFIRPAYDAGIVMAGYFDSLRTPDLVGITPPHPLSQSANFVVKNGTITEGVNGTRFKAMYKFGAVGAAEMANVRSFVSGISSSNFISTTANNNLHDNVFTNQAPDVIDRMDLFTFPVVPGSNSTVANNIFEGGQGGISASDSSNITITSNTIKIRASVTNHYGVIMYNSNNITVQNNRFEPYAGPGVALSTKTTNCNVSNNTFVLKAMPCDTEFPTGLTTPAIRVTDYNTTVAANMTQNNVIHNNTVTGTVSMFSQYPLCKPVLVGFHLSTGGQNEYYENSVNLSTTDASARAIGIYAAAPQTGLFRNNFFESNNMGAWITNPYGIGNNGQYISNTFSKGANPLEYHTFYMGYCCGFPADNHVFTDNQFTNGASMDDIYLFSNQSDHYSYTVKWYLNVNVVNQNNNPITGALVSADATGGGAEHVEALTDSSGKVKLELTQFYREGYSLRINPVSNYTYFAPHTITISKLGYDTHSETVSLSQSKQITATLSSGGAELPTCSSFAYSDWSACQSNNTQTRTITSSSPAGCAGGSPALSQSCIFAPLSTPYDVCASIYYSDWSECQQDKTQKRVITLSFPAGCKADSPVLSQSCVYTNNINVDACTSFIYSDWSECQPNNTQTRVVTSSLPVGCNGGSPVTSQSCAYAPPVAETNESAETSNQTASNQASEEPLYLELNGSLYYGKITPEVETLQKMLSNDETIFPEKKVSGIFGKITEAAVQRFQCRYLTLCSGSYNTNGYGTVGPRTVAKLNEIYGSPELAPVQTQTQEQTQQAGQMTQEERQNLINQLKAQIEALLQQVLQLLQEQLANQMGTQ